MVIVGANIGSKGVLGLLLSLLFYFIAEVL